MKRLFVRLGLIPEGKISRSEMMTHIRKRGWRWVLLVVAIYAIRDAFLYLLLPYLALRGLLFGW
jgi:hypothetical protein